jgi:hypothetical protein
MTSDIFSDARRLLEVAPGVGMMEHAITKLAHAGVENSRIRGWALSISEEYGIIAYTRAAIDRALAGASPETAQEAR